MDCPEIRELADYVETGHGSGTLRSHLGTCDACEDALKSLKEEILSLQISISELWFRENVSCPHRDVLKTFHLQTLDSETRDYVKFHVEELGCTFCQARLGELEAHSSEEEAKTVRRSRARVGEMTQRLLDDLRSRS